MEEESIFEYLARKRLAKERLEKNPNTSDSETLNLALPDYLSPEEPGEDLGELLEQEIEERNYELTDLELSLALDYLEEDYKRSQNYAVLLFERAQRMNPNSKSYDAHLRKSWELTLRATRDVELAIRLDPEVNVILPGAPYEVVFNALQNFREQLYFATEFPSCYKELIPLHREMRKAVGRENYEAAAKLRDEIKGVLLRAQPQIPKMVFSHGFFKNNEYF